MSDVRRQLDATRRRCERVEAENHDLRQILGDIDPVYARSYALLCDIAHLGIRRGTAGVSTPPDSAPPSYHAKAYHWRNEERRAQRKRAAAIHRHLSQIAGELGDSASGDEREHPENCRCSDCQLRHRAATRQRGPGPVVTRQQARSA